jgi:uncharacterized protein (TIGR00369 family)
MNEKAVAKLAEWDKRVQDGSEPPLHRQMGLQVKQLSPTTVLTMELSDGVRGLAPGSVHGGMLATFADVASALSLWDSTESGVQIPATTDMHIRYYRQPKTGPLTAEVEVVHAGHQLLSTECVITDAEHRVLARSTATYVLVPIPKA